MNYFYRVFYYRWFLRNHRNDGQIVKQETQFWKANAIQWLTILFASKASKNAYDSIEKIKEEGNRLNGFLTTRDHNGVESQVTLPILTPEEHIRMNKGKRMHLFLIILLSLIDTFLFSLIAVYFIPPESGPGSKLVFGAIAALSIILCWEGGFSGILTYLKDKKLFKSGQIETMSVSNLKLALGIILIIIAIVLSVSIGLVRMNILEVVDTSTLDSTTMATSNHMKEAGSWASIASMIFGFLTGVLLGFSRVMTDSFGVRGRMFSKYKNSSNRISNLKKGVENFNNRVENDLKDYIERNWKAVLYVRTKLRRDFDEEDRDLAMEFKEARKVKGLEYDVDLYNKYQDVQSMDERLFKYGIFNSEAYINGHEKWDSMMAEYKLITEDLESRHKISNNEKESTYKIPKAAVLALMFACSLFFTSCKEEVPKPASVVIFMDKSNSLTTDTKQFYLNFIEKVMSYLKPGDQVRILPIDKNTESGSIELVSLTIPPPEKFSSPFDPPAQKSTLLKIRFKKFQDSIIKALDTGIERLKQRDIKLENGTDILGAFRVAQRYFDTSKTNVLILCSDMLNFSSELKMEGVKLDKKFINSSLKRLNAKYSNTSFYGLYCITGANDQLAPDIFMGAKNFWINYFQQADFKNVLYISGETSIIDEKFKKLQELKTTKPTSFF